MKKIFYSFIAIATLASFLSCQKEVEIRDSQDNTDGFRYVFSVFDDETRAELSSTGVTWESGDKVGMFLEGYTGYADVNLQTDPKSVILYSSSAIPANTYAYAYYPYDSNNDDKELAHILIPHTQEGGSASAMPLAGVPFRIETEIEPKAKPNGEIHFMNLGAVIDFKVFSDTYDDETISFITFTATSKKTLNNVTTDLAVSGDGYLDLTSVDPEDASTLDLTFGLGTDSDYAKVHNLSTAVATDKASATSVYMVVAPGIYTGTITIGTDVATYTFPFSNKSLARNQIKHYNMDLDNASRVEEVAETVMSLPYSETFATSIGEFETDGVQFNSTDVWQFASGYGMKASAYDGTDKYELESWLTSPWIDLTSVPAAAVTFDHVHKFAGTASNELTFWVLTDESGASWQQLTIPTYAPGSNWTFVGSGEILLNSYVGNKVKIGFKYVSSTENAATWEIKNVNVYEKVYTTEFAQDSDAITVEVGKTKNNHVTVNSEATITYSSDDVSVATVAADGTVTGVAAGTTTINYSVAANGLYPAASGSFDVTVVAAISYSYFTWDLSTDETVSKSDSELGWNYRGVTMVAAKADASTATNNYCPPAQTSTRFYKNSTLTITPYSGSTIGYVEFTATTHGYATALNSSSWSNATASMEDGDQVVLVTVTPDNGADAFSATIGATCGFSSVTVYYTGTLEPLASYTVTLASVSESGCSIAASVGGSPIASGDEVTSGTKVALTATPGSDYVFGSWSVKDASNNDVAVSNNEFTMPSSNVTISATFIRQYTITCNSVSNGSISASAEKAVAGTEITLTATPNSGYVFDSWTVKDASNNDVAVTNDKFSMPSSNVTVSASFVSGNITKGAAWSYTFEEKVWSAAGNQTINEKTWTMSGTGGTFFGYDATKGQQFGSGSSPYSAVTLSSNFGVSYGIDEIRVSTSGAKDISATVSVSVGGTAFECESSTTASLTATNTVYTFVSPDGNVKAGNIQISYSNSSSKAIYIKKIVVNPAAIQKLVMSDITCTDHTSTSVTFGWTAVTGATGYQVSTDGGSTYGSTQQDLSYTWSGREPETDYKIWVKALGDGSEYSDSDPKQSAVGTTDANVGPATLLELDMTTKTYGTSAYNSSTTYGDWTIVNGANNNKGWAYFKMGGKSATLTDYNPCYIYSTAATTAEAGKVTVHLPSGSLSKNGMSVTSWGVYVYSNASMTTQVDYVAGGTITSNEGSFDFEPSEGKTWASGSYFKVSWTLANTTTTNGVVCVDKITVYGK